jgi:hypothetical protein
LTNELSDVCKVRFLWSWKNTSWNS